MEDAFSVQQVYLDRKRLLSPINLLRNIPTITIREIEAEEYMQAYQGMWTFPAPRTNIPSGREDQKAFEARLVELAQGNKPQYSLFEKYEMLLEYCKSFEQYEPFKRTIEYLPEIYGLILNQSTSHDVLNTQYINESFFLEHSVEKGLCEAKKACNIDETEDFDDAQASIVAYLEPQYKTMSISFHALRELIFKLKTETMILDPNPNLEEMRVLEQDKHKADAGKLMFRLEEYVHAFKRDIPAEIQARITFEKLRFRAYYDTLLNPGCVFAMLRLVEDALERRISRVFLTEFRKTVDKVDAEFCKIVHARKSLGLNALEYAKRVDPEMKNRKDFNSLSMLTGRKTSRKDVRRSLRLRGKPRVLGSFKI